MAKVIEKDARVRSQVKAAWGDFKKTSPRIAKALKVGADVLSSGLISKYEIKKAIKKDKALKAKKKKEKEII
tara:strand:+ start:381 stop:596 length:216 start_codon:yes stop_codon:yes gene_type:complete